MRKLLLIVLIFLIIGAVSAHDDINSTTEPLLKDTTYNYNLDDDDGLVVEKNDYIPVDIKVDESCSLNVYIDSHESAANDEFENVSNSQISIPTSVIINDEEVPLDLGKHNIRYEFKFINTTSVYQPETYISDSGVTFDFKLIRNSKNPQNTIYRFSSQFTIIENIEPIVKTIYLDYINITYSDSFFSKLRE